MNIAIGILLFSVIVGIHELGHFLASLYFKVRVKEFSIGFGPKIFTIKTKVTKFSLRIIPLGGFVDIAGMSNKSRIGFNIKPYYQKMIILSAGVIANILLSFSIIFAISLYLGHINLESNKINRVLSEKAILQVGDEVTSINNIKVNSWKEIKESLKNINKDFCLEISRNGKYEKIDIKIEDKEKVFLSIPSNRSLLKSLLKASEIVIRSFYESSKSLYKAIKRKAEIKDFSGPIGIFNTMNKTSGVINILFLAALISLSLAFFNILPVPPLDGGKMFIITLKKLKINISNESENAISFAIMILLIIFTFIIGKSDVKKIREERSEKIKSIK